jgi:xylulokinase
VALEYAVYKRALLELYGQLPFKELRITGGGEKSPLWNAIKADAMQMPVRRIAESEGAPVGAALVAGYGVGLIRSLPAAAGKWITLGEKTSPRKSLALYYARRLDRYQALLRGLENL